MAILRSDVLALQVTLGTTVTGVVKKTAKNQSDANGNKLIEFVVIEFSNGIHIKLGDIGQCYWSVHDTGKVTNY